MKAVSSCITNPEHTKKLNNPERIRRCNKDSFEVHDRYVFLYDNEGKPHALYYYYNGSTTPTKYYYVLNLQGDVVQLRDSSYAVVANYTYDAWGKLLSVTNVSGAAITSSTNIANINPIRYRGYFYDTETKLYYCNSRYYDPQIKRFINADELLSTGTGFLGYNMFAYCNNNPVMHSDPSGETYAYEAPYGAGPGMYGGPVAYGDASPFGGGGTYKIPSVFIPIIIVFGEWSYRVNNAIGTDALRYEQLTMRKLGVICITSALLENEDDSEQEQTPPVPDVQYPGDDSSISPGDDYEWKGKPPKGGNKGAWVNRITKESWHLDLNHPGPIGPHWDYKDIFGFIWRVFKNKLPELKK